ncbi:transcriptional regulator [Vibrio ishigakensis]|uniref:Transcriptional regulator n=1 Tax=Vibrio ishigakensis TaxID=1481914 RepID=A0A0B8QEF1_9VIBR|nr:transcriptional regulator [Vibrio ishigakensis]
MISLNVEHLHYFTTVVETGTFTAAGRRLNRDRSSIGQAIANLEIDLGVSLFNRNGRVITLTSEGESLYSRARTLVQNYQAFCQFSQNISSGIEEHLNIGVDFLTTNHEIASLDRAISEQFPGITVHWQSHLTEQLDKLLANGELDLALRMYQNRDLPEDFHPKHIDNIAMTCVVNSEFGAENNLTHHHADLRKLPLIVYPGLESVIRTDRFELTQSTFSPSASLEIIKQKPSWGVFPQKLIDNNETKYKQTNIDTKAPLYSRRVLIWHHKASFGSAKQWLISEIGPLLCQPN